MKLEKFSLVAMLLEVGEENAAVLLARSQLPDEIDTDRDHDALLTFGLERDQIEEVSRLAIGVIDPDDVNSRHSRGDLEKTISRRWADLVDQWMSYEATGAKKECRYAITLSLRRISKSDD